MRKRFNTEHDRVWFIADTHFGHEAIISHSHRPFECEWDMHSVLERDWNDVVGKRDHIFILGDFSFMPRKATMQLAKRLNGIKYLIAGNHDRMIEANPCGIFEGGVKKYHEIYVDMQKIVMCHFAFRSWNAMQHGSWNLHGHSHGNLPPQGMQLDVGVDNGSIRQFFSRVSYGPISFQEVKQMMAYRQIESHDHHQPKGETHE
jgi:calcineurin-like phosphoesterase family protein